MFKTVQQAYNQIMKEKEGGYTSSYSQNRGGTGSYGYDGDYQNDGQNGGYGNFGGDFWGYGPFGFGGYGGSGSASNMNGNDQTTIHLRAAANYINNGGYDEALNVLNSMEDRDARWYYYSAQANAGKGNQATAMEHARRAVELAPDNMQYRMFYQRMNSGGEWYTGRQQTYQNPGRSMGGWCMRLILLNLACNCCLGGGGLCCPGGYYY
jgi:molecular chaperone DnaJ